MRGNFSSCGLPGAPFFHQEGSQKNYYVPTPLYPWAGSLPVPFTNCILLEDRHSVLSSRNPAPRIVPGIENILCVIAEMSEFK